MFTNIIEIQKAIRCTIRRIKESKQRVFCKIHGIYSTTKPLIQTKTIQIEIKNKIKIKIKVK